MVNGRNVISHTNNESENSNLNLKRLHCVIHLNNRSGERTNGRISREVLPQTRQKPQMNHSAQHQFIWKNHQAKIRTERWKRKQLTVSINDSKIDYEPIQRNTTKPPSTARNHQSSTQPDTKQKRDQDTSFVSFHFGLARGQQMERNRFITCTPTKTQTLSRHNQRTSRKIMEHRRADKQQTDNRNCI